MRSSEGNRRVLKTDILWTKSPNRFRYAESLEGPLAVLGISSDDELLFVAVLSIFLFLEPSTVADPSILEFLITSGDTWGWEWEWECPCASSSPPRTRKVFSMKKNAANPTNIPKLKKLKSTHSISGYEILTQWGYSVSLLPWQNEHQNLGVHP